MAKFIKDLLSSDCKRRELKDIEDVKSETKKYLEGGMHAKDNGQNDDTAGDEDQEIVIKFEVKLENRKNKEKDARTITDKK